MILCHLDSSIWKEKFIDWMNPHSDSKLIDVASGLVILQNYFQKKNNSI